MEPKLPYCPKPGSTWWRQRRGSCSARSVPTQSKDPFPSSLPALYLEWGGEVAIDAVWFSGQPGFKELNPTLKCDLRGQHTLKGSCRLFLFLVNKNRMDLLILQKCKKVGDSCSVLALKSPGPPERAEQLAGVGEGSTGSAFLNLLLSCFPWTYATVWGFPSGSA